MDIEVIRSYCLDKAGTEEGFPFGEDTLVFKVMGKMFALMSLTRLPLQINLKCDPDYAIELRDEYPDFILPGYHMSKKHWNTVILESDLEEKLILSLIDQSYDLVVASLSKKLRSELENLS